MQPSSLPSPENDLWVFGYGSLMWQPGFAYEEKHIAKIEGFHRSFCVVSHVHRGTVENPGLVLGLDQGGTCTGMAFRVAAEYRAETIAYLHDREQVTNVYIEQWLPAEIAERGTKTVLTYAVDRSHAQYSGALSDAEKLALIRQGVGISGANPDYVRSTHQHLLQMGIDDPDMARLVAAL